MKKNPYSPPKTNPARRSDSWNEGIHQRSDDETDWVSFFWIVLFLFIFFFHNVLFKFFVELFRDILYD